KGSAAPAEPVELSQAEPADPAGSPAEATAQPVKATRAAAKASPAKTVPPRSVRSAAETEKIRVALSDRRDELKAEYDQTLAAFPSATLCVTCKQLEERR